MKIITALSFVLGAVFFGTAIAGEDHKIATAPADYLEMENPNDVDDVDDGFLKSAKKIYKRKCKKCHGKAGDGKGSAADDMEIKPTAFNEADYLEKRKDGQLFWIMIKGSEGTDMEPFGPGSDVNLSEEEIWKVITYMRKEFTK